MSFSPMAPKRQPNALELIDAMRDAGEALALAQASDFGSIEVALSRLEVATTLLANARPATEEHPAVRAEIDRAGSATRRLFEQMIDERERLGAELAAASRARKAQQLRPSAGFDVSG